jgi:hypothetical protein
LTSKLPSNNRFWPIPILFVWGRVPLVPPGSPGYRGQEPSSMVPNCCSLLFKSWAVVVQETLWKKTQGRKLLDSQLAIEQWGTWWFTRKPWDLGKSPWVLEILKVFCL